MNFFKTNSIIIFAGSAHDSSSESNENDQLAEEVHHDISQQRNKKDRRRKKRSNNKVRANIATKAQISAPLQMLSSITTDSIIRKKQRIDGDEGKPNRMLLNLIPTSGKSILNVRCNDPFFDRSRAQRVEIENNNDYDVPADDFVELPIKVNRELLLIRPLESGYALKENLDDEDDDFW